jgi:hypothetical protein
VTEHAHGHRLAGERRAQRSGLVELLGDLECSVGPRDGRLEVARPERRPRQFREDDGAREGSSPASSSARVSRLVTRITSFQLTDAMMYNVYALPWPGSSSASMRSFRSLAPPISPAAQRFPKAPNRRRRSRSIVSGGVTVAANWYSSAADVGAPLASASLAACSNAPATSSLGPSTESARWRARSSGPVAMRARSAWTSRSMPDVAPLYTVEARRGCVNSILPSRSSTIPASSASSSPDRSPPARSTRVGVGRREHAVNSKVCLADIERADSRSRSSSWRSIGTGRGSPGRGFGSPRSSARPISTAKNGFPPDAS